MVRDFEDEEPEDEFTVDITNIGKNGRRKRIASKKSDFLYENKTVEEYLEERIDKSKGERRIANIPLDVIRNLPEAPTQWEAIQLYVIQRNTDIIVNKAVWEVSQAIEKENEPEEKEYYRKRTPAGYTVMQTREEVLLEGNIMEKSDEINRKISRLSELFGSIHQEAVRKAVLNNESETVQALRKQTNVKELEKAKIEIQLLKAQFEESEKKRVKETENRIQELKETIDALKIKIKALESENQASKDYIENLKGILKPKQLRKLKE